MEPSSTTFSACRKLDRETTRARHHTKTCWSVVVTWQDKLLTTSRNTQGKWIFPMNWQRTQSFFPLNWTAHWCGIIGLQWLLEDPPWRCSSIPVRTATHLWSPTVSWGPVYHPHSAWLHVSVTTISGRFWRVPLIFCSNCWGNWFMKINELTNCMKNGTCFLINGFWVAPDF